MGFRQDVVLVRLEENRLIPGCERGLMLELAILQEAFCFLFLL